MKIFLVQNAQLDQLHAPEQRGPDNQRIVSFLVAVTPSSIRPVNEADPEEVQLCNSLRRQLESEGDSAGLLQCELTTVDATSKKACFRVLSGSLTKALFELIGETARVQVTVSYSKIKEYPGFYSGSFKTSEMKIINGRYACEDTNIYQDLPFRLESCLRGGAATLKFVGSLTITISKDTSSGGPVVSDKMQVNKKMLLEELGSDLVIIAGNGMEVKAHTGFLSAHSDVFRAMFQSDMKEAKTRSVEMLDMSEEGVRALLAYLYYWEEIVPNTKPNVAFEMLQAGHKYDIPVLEAAMKKLLLAKPANWFDGDVALKLFYFAKKLPEDGERLKMKAIKVMKMNFDNFKESTTYVNLFEEDPKTAMEICSYFAA